MKTSGSTSHVLPLRIYFGVAGALLGLTGITVTISFIHLGGWNLVVALTIAGIKALLVAFFFMHLWYDNKFYLFIFSMAVVFLVILIIFTMFDTLERNQIYDIKAQSIRPQAVLYDGTKTDTLKGTHNAEFGDSTVGDTSGATPGKESRDSSDTDPH